MSTCSNCGSGSFTCAGCGALVGRWEGIKPSEPAEPQPALTRSVEIPEEALRPVVRVAVEYLQGRHTGKLDDAMRDALAAALPYIADAMLGEIARIAEAGNEKAVVRWIKAPTLRSAVLAVLAGEQEQQ